jgi:hypothetical protein
MNNQNLIIYENEVLYDVLYEIADQLQFSIIKLNKKDLVKLNIFKNNSFLFITEKKIPNISNQIILNKLPLNVFKFIERLNIQFLRFEFNKQSNIKINIYTFDLNSREMIYQNQKLKLTEKEIDSIIYLFSMKKPVNVQELQQKVWGYQSDLETHTVGTHIYRLRKKILKKFNDTQFIKSTPSGYQIN